MTHCVLSVSSKYDSCESLVCRSASCLLTDESISRTTSSSWPCGQCKDAVRSLIWFSAATSSARFSISFSIRRKFSSLAEKTQTGSDVHYRSVASKTALILLELNYLTCLNNSTCWIRWKNGYFASKVWITHKKTIIHFLLHSSRIDTYTVCLLIIKLWR